MINFKNNIRKYIGMLMICLIISSSIFMFNNNVFAEVTFSHHSSTDFDIKGPGGIKTSYNNNGYATVLKVGSTQGNVVNGTGTVAGVTCTTTGTSISNGNYVKVNYHLINNNSSAVTISLASHADIQINTNDSAPITALSGGRGFTMTDGTYMFMFIGKDSYGVTDIDSYWFGKYSERTNNLWNQVTSTGITGIDSGMAYAWKDRTLAANSSMDLSILFGVGDLNEPPTLTATNTLKDKYFVNEDVQLIGKVNDIDNGDIVTIKYAVDGGTEYTVPGTYTPNGTAVDYTATFTIPGDITEGNHTIQIWAADNKGNMSKPVSKTFYVELDKEAPTGEFEIEPTDWTNGDVTIKVKAIDAYSGVKQITLPDNTIVSSDTANFTATQNGDYLFILQDNANNKRNYTITISNIDNENPEGTATITQPTEEVRNAIINFTATDIGSGVAKIIKPDGTEVAATTVAYDILTSGIYSFKVVDKVGNQSTIDINAQIVSDGAEVKYIDQVTKLEIDTKEIISGNVGSNYTTTAKDIDGYELVVTPENANGALTIDKQIIVYEYRKNSNVTVKYIDENYNTNIIDNIVTKYKEGDTYTTEEKTFDGYSLTTKTENTSGTVGKDDIIVEYKYKKKSAGVEIKYIDQVTKLEILEATHQEGLENDEYTIQPKEINGYELVLTPENATGNMTLEKITVTFEYRKNSNVTVKYIDDNYNTNIIDDIVTKYKEGDTYTTEEKTFDGYRLITKTENTSGVVERENITVEYRYKKISAGVEVKYIDEATNEEISDGISIEGLENDEYTTEEKEIDGYELIKIPENSIGLMAVEKTEVIYGYRKNSNVTVKYIDENYNTNIIDDIVTKYKEGDAYTTEEKTFEGYALISKTYNTSGMIARDDITVEYRYKKISAGVEIKYIDQVTGEDIAEKVIKTGLEKMPYTSMAKEIAEYELVKVPENATGEMKVEKTTVVYEYRKNSYVTTRYINENNGYVLSTQLDRKYKEGDTYTTVGIDIDGYTITKIDGEATGTVGKEDIIVTYYYKKNTSVVVKYVDMLDNDREIAEEVIISGLQNDDYETEEKKISGYTFVEIGGIANGKMGFDTREVIYKYKKASNLITEHRDANTNEKIIDDVVKAYKEGDTYEAHSQKLDGYILVQEPDEKIGVMGRENVTKTFYYKRISEGLVVRYVDRITNEVLDRVVYEGNENDKVTLEEKSFLGYVLDERPNYEDATLGAEAQEISFYYKKAIKLNIVGIDQETGTNIYSTTMSGIEGDPYETTPRTIAGYELVRIPENHEGIFNRENTNVTYEYRKIGARVVAKYIDKETNQELDSYTITGKVGENYKTERKKFDNYTLVEVVGQEVGTLSEETKEVIYYYERKNGKVIVTYEDENGNELLKEELTGKVGEDYNVIVKDIIGYEVVEIPENTSGKYEEITKELVIKLQKIEEKGTVVVKYIDKDGNEILKEELIGKVGEKYHVTVKKIPGYNLVEIPDNITGIYEKDIIEVVIIVETIKPIEKGKVVIKYIDENEKEILTEEMLGDIGEIYSVHIKNIPGYKIVKIPANRIGKYKEGTIEVIIKIEKEEPVIETGKVIVKYIDQDGKEISKEELTGKVGENYKVTIKELSGYKQINVEGKIEGQYTKEEQEVIVRLEKEEVVVEIGKVVVKYIDQDGKEISKEELAGKVGEDYKVIVKDIPGYKQVSITGDTTGQYTKEEQEVIVRLEKEEIPVETGKVVVKYVDQDGKEILREELIGKVGEGYKITVKNLTGYDIVEIPENTTGKYGNGTIEVIIKVVDSKVKPINQGTIVVKHIDENENIIKEDYIENGEIGKYFSYEVPEIKGYKIIGNKKIKEQFVDGRLVFEAKYEKIVEEEIDTNKPEENNPFDLPNTGDINIVLYAIMFVILGNVLLKKIKAQK